MKLSLLLLAASLCPYGVLSAVSTDESLSTADILSAVNSAVNSIDHKVQETAIDGTVSSPEPGALSCQPHERIFIRLSFNADEDTALSTIVDDRKSKLQISEKIVVIGPDGKHQEFAISGNDAGKVFKIVTGVETTGNEKQHANQIESIVRLMKLHDASETEADGKTMGEARMAIGVQCDCVPDALRSHLNLGEKGIMVGHVREESPASEAALEEFDIIVQIGDADVKTTNDLVSAVAASEGKELTLSIIRHGQPLKVAVTPRKMEFPVLLAPAQTRLFLGDVNAQISDELAGDPAGESLPESAKKQMEGQISVQNSLRKFHPGIVIEQRMPSNEKDMQGLIEHARKLAEESGRVAQIRTQKAFDAVESGASEAVAANIEALREQMRAMEQKLEQLEKRLAAQAEEKE